MHILLTGATGFVGRGICASNATSMNVRFVAALREPSINLSPCADSVVYGDISQEINWKGILSTVDVVIHAAARVHVMRDRALDPLAEYRKVNVKGTLSLARQAAEAGVKRFIFLSTVKVNGFSTLPCRPFNEHAGLMPSDPYAISKKEAEDGLWRLAGDTGMDVVVIRLPLVYGPGVKGNFFSLMRWLYKGIPLPLGAIHNKRSMVALDNLVDLILTCVDHPAAANQVFFVSDGEDLSTTELLMQLSGALGRHARLLPVPSNLLELGAVLCGRQAVAQRLCGSLQVDITKARELLGWSPPVSVKDALHKTAEDFLKRNNR